LSADERYLIECANFCIALAYNDLLRLTSDPSMDFLQLQQSNDHIIPRINFTQFIRLLSHSVSSLDVSIAFNYLLLIKDKEELKTELKAFVTSQGIHQQTALLGDMTENGVKLPGLADKFSTLIGGQAVVLDLINEAAKKSESLNQFENSMKLYNLAGNFDRVLQILIKRISFVINTCDLREISGILELSNSILTYYSDKASLNRKNSCLFVMKILEFKRETVLENHDSALSVRKMLN
jgi:hypothetical protein